MDRFEEFMVENRSSVGLLPMGPAGVDRAANYGIPGAGYWGQGMVWNSSSSGPVTTDSAMALSAVFACLRLLSEAICTLPLDTFTRTNGTRLPYRPRPDYLSFQPPQGSRIDYLSMVMLSLLTDGNAFIATPRDRSGVPVNLVPLDPGSIEVKRQTQSPTEHLPYRYGEIYYTFGEAHFSQLDIMHIKGMCLAGALRGVSPLRAAREVIAGGSKAQDYGISLFDNSSVPPAVIEIPGGDGDDAEGDAARVRARRIATTWNDTHGGTANAGKVGVLLGGATLKTIAVTPEDAQWLDTRKFAIQEIARYFGVPPHLIADSSNSTSWGSGLAEQNLAFGQLSLRPWIERIEDAHGRLLSTHGLPDVFIKLNLDALLRASLSDRYESYSAGIDSGFLTINEARRLEDLPPVAWGDDPPALAPGGAP